MPDQDEQFKLFCQLTKVDENLRQVWGRATQETPDSVREMLDYDSSKPNFAKWSDAAKSRTSILGPDGQSLGPIREMHQGIAAGKVISLDFNDVEKAIDIGTYCADDDSWAKIKAGVLTGFSIGGKYVKRWPDREHPGVMRYTADPSEISYVDSPAVPTATYTLIKADGSEEIRKIGPGGVAPVPSVGGLMIAEFRPDQDGQTVPTIAEHFPIPDLIQDTSSPITAPLVAQKIDAPDWINSFIQAVNDLKAMNKASSDMDSVRESKLKDIGSRVGIARREGEPLTPPKDYPSDLDQYGDPANHSWPCDTKERCSSAIAYFNGGKGLDQYSGSERHTLGRRIADRASGQLGHKYQYSPSGQKITQGDESKMNKADFVDIVYGRLMTTALRKDGLGDLMGQIKQVLNVIVDQITQDPGKLLSLLESSNNSSSVSFSSGATAPTGGGQGDGVGKGTPTSDSTTSGTTPGTPTTVGSGTGSTVTTTGTTLNRPNDTATAMTLSSPPSNVTDQTYKALTDLLDRMDKRLAAIEKPETPVNKGLPVGDLAAIVPPVPTEELHPALKALLNEPVNPLLKAAQIAGSVENPNLGAVYEMALGAAQKAFDPVIAQIALSHMNGGWVPTLPATAPEVKQQ